MDEKNGARGEIRTAWHPLLVLVIEHFAPAHRKVLPEYHLNRLPLRVDIVVLEQEGVGAAPVRKLRCIFEHTRRWTLIEYKGVTDDLDAADVLVLLGYACQYMAMHKISDFDEMCLMVIADCIPRPFVARIEQLGGTFEYIGNGLWGGQLCGLKLHGVELREAYMAGPSERLLYLFTREFLRNPLAKRFTEGLDEEELRLYDLLCQHIQQLRRDPGTMHIKDIDVAEQNLAAARKKLIANAPIEDRLDGLTPEQRFTGHYHANIDQHPAPDPSPEGWLQQPQAQAAISIALNGLAPMRGDIFILHVVDDLGHAEITQCITRTNQLSRLTNRRFIETPRGCSNMYSQST